MATAEVQSRVPCSAPGERRTLGNHVVRSFLSLSDWLASAPPKVCVANLDFDLLPKRVG